MDEDGRVDVFVFLSLMFSYLLELWTDVIYTLFLFVVNVYID